METIHATIQRITYRNSDNGYTILKAYVKGQRDTTTVICNMPDVHVGSVFQFTGDWKMNPQYGRQFVASEFEEKLPSTVYGIEKYLGSGLIKGIGPGYAKRIVDFFGKDTLDIIDNDPDRLLEVPGIGKSKIEKIIDSWKEQKEIKNIMVFLQGHDISASLAAKIYKKYGDKSIETVTENPYRLADEIWGIGFLTADTIAAKMGFGHERYARLRSGILYTLNRLSEDGHCYALRQQLVDKAEELLTVEDNLVNMTLDEMIRTSDVITDIDEESSKEGEIIKAIYLPPFYYSESGVAKRLDKIMSAESTVKVKKSGLESRIKKTTGMEYDEIQMDAIRAAVDNKILILTGGPGTGKTTTTLGIITAFKSSGANIVLAAPTGRAAKRLSETTGMEARTIHRLLEARMPSGYNRNEDNPIDGDVLIVDECSMIDILLMYNLLKAVPDNMRVIFVGDVDQLPSVGAGNVLHDLIDCGCFPVVRLTKIFRQAQTSNIIMNAHRINTGEMPVFSNSKDSDFFFANMGNHDKEVRAEKAADTIVELVKDKLPKYYKVSPTDIQVLTPMQKGVVGTINLNQVLQEALNPDRSFASLKFGGYTYREKDKVMQIRNNYEKNVFNGDVGVVAYVNQEDKNLVVDYDGHRVTYGQNDLDELVLAYATTIHKSQGSEYPIVVMPILMNHYIMLQRNLLYTGITRAKNALVVVGTKNAIAYAVNNVTITERNSLLKQRIQKNLEKI